MKKIFVLLIFSCASTVVFAQKDSIGIKASIVGFFNGLSLISSDTLKYYTTGDFHLLEDGEIWNMDTLINRITPRKGLGIKRINHFKFIMFRQKGNMAWVSYFNTAELSLGDKQQKINWLESAVLVEERNRWKIQMLHSTKLK
jgi:hypothetical protein